jgi:hypothetical protein
MSWNTSANFPLFLRFFEAGLQKDRAERGKTMDDPIIGNSSGTQNGNTIIQQMREGTELGKAVYNRAYNNPATQEQFKEWKKTLPLEETFEASLEDSETVPPADS